MDFAAHAPPGWLCQKYEHRALSFVTQGVLACCGSFKACPEPDPSRHAQNSTQACSGQPGRGFCPGQPGRGLLRAAWQRLLPRAAWQRLLPRAAWQRLAQGTLTWRCCSLCWWTMAEFPHQMALHECPTACAISLVFLQFSSSFLWSPHFFFHHAPAHPRC